LQDFFRPALRQATRTASNVASQVAVAVVTGVCVALITNAILAKADDVGRPEQTSVQAPSEKPLPALQPVVISDVPEPLSAAPAAIAAPPVPLGGAGLYFAEEEHPVDPLQLITAPGLPPA
jgi:hypothetical protein